MQLRGFKYLLEALGNCLTLPDLESIYLPAYKGTPSCVSGPNPVSVKAFEDLTNSATNAGIYSRTYCQVRVVASIGFEVLKV